MDYLNFVQSGCANAHKACYQSDEHSFLDSDVVILRIRCCDPENALTLRGPPLCTERVTGAIH